jgi:hypothetical protein
MHDSYVFRSLAIGCIFTQIINPLLAYFEPFNQDEVSQGIYEHNWQYYTRNTLTSLAIVILSTYILVTGLGLSRELARFDQL